MARRGIFAELQYQNKKAARKRQQASTIAARQNAAAQRQAEQAALRSERARKSLAFASAADQKRAAQEAHKLHVEAVTARVEAMSADLSESFDVIDSLLSESLSATTPVNLEDLRVKAVHPLFSAPEFETPMPTPVLIIAPAEPVFVEPLSPKGLGAALGGRRHHAEIVERAKKAFEIQHQHWQAEASKIPSIQLGQMQAHQRYEEGRLEKLAEVRKIYYAECQQREAEANDANSDLDDLIVGLTRNDKEALQTYVSIVLGNSAYPESFPVTYDYEFDPELKELSIKVTIPGPRTLSTVREYKYNKSRDEIQPINLTQKQIKDRYADAVYSVALRTLHEVFEGDQVGRVQTIALSVGAEDIDPATGLMKWTALVAVAVDREAFSTYDLSKVVPLATLQFMKALISKSPYEMLGIDESRGVRDRGK